jgi:hypothetical protein
MTVWFWMDNIDSRKEFIPSYRKACFSGYKHCKSHGLLLHVIIISTLNFLSETHEVRLD